MSFVPVKGPEQQGLSMLHRARSHRPAQLINAVRGHLSELGIIAETRPARVGRAGDDYP